MIDLAKVINEKLIDAINKAEARANELVREEGAERAEPQVLSVQNLLMLKVK